MGSINKQISRFETTAVYTHPDAKVDIVLVHGLNGEPQKTWTAKNGVFWPTDLLPGSLRDAKANILVYGYNADVYSKKHGGNPSDNFIYMHAQTLVTSLTHYRKDEMSSRNPIIWVVHSLGGILLKRALLYSNDLKTSQHEDYRGIYVSTYGIIFLGTPHTGSDMGSWAVTLQAMSDAVVPKAFWHSESILLKTLKKDNETLQNINSHFLDIYQRFKIMMAHENHATDLKGTKMLVVDAQSASPQLPGVGYFSIEATHSGMCKFDSKNAPGYRTVATSIRDWVGEAPDVISTRWRVEDDEKLARAKHEIEERMKPWLKSQQLQPGPSSSMSDASTHASISGGGQPLLPERSASSRHSSPFEIEEIDSPIDAKPTQGIGDASRLQLPEPDAVDVGPEPPSQDSTDFDTSNEPLFVKPSVFKPNTFFKGRDREMKDLHKRLMDRARRSVGTSSVLVQSMPGGGKTHLARQYVFEHKYDYPGGIFWIRSKSIQELEYGYWDIAKTVKLREIEGLDEDELNDRKKMVKAVQGWLSRNEGWLLVLDGVLFDLPSLETFIPYAKNTSIIYTSTEKTAGEEYQFDNPQVIALDSLTPREAQELLLEEMGKRKPWNQDDLSRAMELVQLMERLPLMIHVAAQQMKATREPLSKYLRAYKSRPKAGNLPAYRAVREQLEHRGNFAALNLMSLLAFFSQHIPVEMLACGLKALTRETPVKTSDPQTRKGSLNNTFKVLIAFALIERNENDETSSTSDKSSRSVDMAQDNLDILRIHGIVQAFFVDVLADERLAHYWLARAIHVFCCAFDESDRRIQDDSTTGMPEDYLRFSIHGKKLSGFLDRFERKYPELSDARELLETRLDGIQIRIDQLNKRKKTTDQDDQEEQVVSVFERTNSLSEVDSSTPPSSSSLVQIPLYDESNVPVESPTPYSPADHNPYHWHVTFPYGIAVPEDGDISRTVTPQPAPTEIFESISVPEDYETQPQATDHRTVRRHSERRYRDTAGAWRAAPQILSDPRVSLSREIVKGVISPPSAPNQRAEGADGAASDRGASSDAEMRLNKITKAAPPPSKGAVAQDGIPLKEGSLTMRPKLIPGRPSYSDAHAKEAVENDNPTATFSNILGTGPPPSSSYTAATLLRLKEAGDKPISTEGLAPVKVSSPLSAGPLTTVSTSPTLSPQSPLSEIPDVVDPSSQHGSRASSGQPTRSARSSPMQLAGPFSPPPIPVEVHQTSSLRSIPGTGAGIEASIYSRPEEFVVYEDEYEPMTHSLPSVRPYPSSRPPSPPYPHGSPLPQPLSVSVHPPPWTASEGRLEYHPRGYWSQPMSRDTSHQSTNSLGSTHSQPLRNRSPLIAPTSMQGAGSAASSPGVQAMQRPQSRRPSVVETEPSPLLGSAGFEMEPTSYQIYHDSVRGRLRTGSIIYPAQVVHVVPGTSQRPGFFRRFSRRRRGTAAMQHRRAGSASGRLTREDLGNSTGLRGSPDLRGTGGAFHTNPGYGTGSGQDMARSASGSGGFKLDDGTVVGFGSSSTPGERSYSQDNVGLGLY
ncbi:hypothetical protein PFICI_14404 [Pestalotiopsis fici W106-1]|uniref:Uncharacterized protein n=1 Tax=Pestalotiopsis fici (strain W106-1 / CGMCC3.15140) TaxID=1229662 RepID=W3WHU0_PESFW|nr:uncharacterized protein PFICI_14404 [Pestalotiopsis fici W106-1]ETS73458.1 hypothetical protein PFICI_14404 [Pestalotiopsis fici W106-1]